MISQLTIAIMISFMMLAVMLYYVSIFRVRMAEEKSK